ncbi:hypothetical protein ACJX0J_039590, partial [Zea mays]
AIVALVIAGHPMTAMRRVVASSSSPLMCRLARLGPWPFRCWRWPSCGFGW